MSDILIDVKNFEKQYMKKTVVKDASFQVKEGMTLTEEEVDEFCVDLPRYKRPRKIIFANVIRNATGKIDKPKLREIYAGAHIVEDQNQS